MSYDLRNTSIGAYADIGSSSPQGSYLHRINDTGVGGAYDRKNSGE